ncbi:MAG TPA: glycosyltransferase, partial [Methanosarcina sp.]|nr:glycosyltransferase [Methanosarcina sp.]
MKAIIFTHPKHMNSQSMPRFASSIADSLKSTGCHVDVISSHRYISKYFKSPFLSKWLNYIDQFIIFPQLAKSTLKKLPNDYLLIFCDQALGPWVHLAANRPHVIHTHDLLALKSALDLIPENATSKTGKIYQKFIRRGFQKGLRFIAISNKTKADLIEFGGIPAHKISVVLNELNFDYRRMPVQEAATVLRRNGFPTPEEGMILHVGGSQWYKNKLGIIKIYAAYAARNSNPLALWLVGPKPTGAVA